MHACSFLSSRRGQLRHRFRFHSPCIASICTSHLNIVDHRPAGLRRRARQDMPRVSFIDQLRLACAATPRALRHIRRHRCCAFIAVLCHSLVPSDFSLMPAEKRCIARHHNHSLYLITRLAWRAPCAHRRHADDALLLSIWARPRHIIPEPRLIRFLQPPFTARW